MMIIGIDVGKNGGIAIWMNDKYNSIKMPETTADMYSYLSKCKDMAKSKNVSIRAYLELVHAMPNEGVKSAFSFGKNFGELQGILTSLEISFETVSPQKWMNVIGKPTYPTLNEHQKDDPESEKKMKTKRKTLRKNYYKDKAQKLFPDTKVTLATADALLIMEYGRRLNVG